MAGADIFTDGDNQWDRSLFPTFRYSLVLYYYPSLPTTVIQGLERTVPEGVSERSMSWTPSAVAAGGANLNPDNLSDPTDTAFSAHPLVTGSYDLHFPQCWGLRGHAYERQARVSIAFAGGAASQQLTNAEGNSLITATAPYVQAGMRKGRSITLPLQAYPIWPFDNKAIIGDAGMRLDLSQVRRAGLHSGGRFILTAELY